jgi:hypothetical protein
MGFFSDKCIVCKTEEKVQMCQFCQKMVCDTCLRLLVYKGETPKWFVGKKVKDFTEYRDLNLEYCKLIKKKGGHIHCCDKYLQEAWIMIEEQVKRLEYDRDQKADLIILK